jgi:hypothetical protein
MVPVVPGFVPPVADAVAATVDSVFHAACDILQRAAEDWRKDGELTDGGAYASGSHSDFVANALTSIRIVAAGDVAKGFLALAPVEPSPFHGFTDRSDRRVEDGIGDGAGAVAHILDLSGRGQAADDFLVAWIGIILGKSGRGEGQRARGHDQLTHQTSLLKSLAAR